MVGALFSVTNILLSLAEDGDAPKLFAEKNQKGTPIKALLLTGVALGAFLIFSYVLPGTIYEYVTTAAGVMLILNWIIILSSQIKLRRQSKSNTLFQMSGYPATSYLGIALILVTVSGGLLHPTQRMGVLISLGFIVLIIFSHRLIFRQPRTMVGIRKMRED
jgi:L-asparagine transporter-like permease